MQGSKSRANQVVTLLDADDFNGYSCLRKELELLYVGHPKELHRLLVEAGLGEAMLRFAERMEMELGGSGRLPGTSAATLRRAAQAYLRSQERLLPAAGR